MTYSQLNGILASIKRSGIGGCKLQRSLLFGKAFLASLVSFQLFRQACTNTKQWDFPQSSLNESVLTTWIRTGRFSLLSISRVLL